VGTQSGDVTITYSLSDSDGNACSITVQYQGGSVGSTWTTATVTGTTSGIAPGAGKTIVWKSATDEAGLHGSDYRIRITPNDGEDSGTAGTTSAFAVDNRLSWAYTTGGDIATSPAIATDGTIYIGGWDKKLYAINPDGTLKWSYTAGDAISSSSPAVATDGTIYFGCDDGKLYALNPDGSFKWEYASGDQIWNCPAIAADGTVYVGSRDNSLYAINPDGTLKWSYATGDRIGFASPAIAADGTVYVGSYDNNLYALNPDGTLKWTYAAGNTLDTPPAIAADGTVYVGCDDNKLYAINPDGTLKWTYTTGNEVWGIPVIDSDGTVYVGSLDNKLHAVNPDGSGKWTYSTGAPVDGGAAIGNNGTIYFGSNDHKFYALNPDGTLKWSYETGDTILCSSPVIDGSGIIYIGSYDNKLYALKTTSTGLAATQWPMFMHDTKHTGRVGAPLGPAAAAEETAALLVPGSEYSTIQEAIDAARPGDHVEVLAGEYWENLDFGGKAITVESEAGPERTVIMGLDEGLPAVSFVTGEGPGSVLKGFTVRGGSVGVLARGSLPTLSDNVIVSGVDCDSPLTCAWLKVTNDGLPGFSGPDVDGFVGWLTAGPMRFMEDIQSLGSTPKPSARAKVIAPAGGLTATAVQTGGPGSQDILVWIGLLLLATGFIVGFEAARRWRAVRRQADT